MDGWRGDRSGQDGAPDAGEQPALGRAGRVAAPSVCSMAQAAQRRPSGVRLRLWERQGCAARLRSDNVQHPGVRCCLHHESTHSLEFSYLHLTV